jgi:hypothetical protein
VGSARWTDHAHGAREAQVAVDVSQAPGHCEHVAAERPRLARWGVAIACTVGLVLLVASRWNPIMTSAANNRLEAPCADPAIARVIETDRSAWTPFLWSCTVRHPNGQTETNRPW